MFGKKRIYKIMICGVHYEYSSLNVEVALDLCRGELIDVFDYNRRVLTLQPRPTVDGDNIELVYTVHMSERQLKKFVKYLKKLGSKSVSIKGARK